MDFYHHGQIMFTSKLRKYEQRFSYNLSANAPLQTKLVFIHMVNKRV